jgi:hypothetical protein
MGWSRDLGIVTADDIDAKAIEATTVEVIDHVAKKFTRESQLGAHEQASLADAIATAKGGIAALGGTAHVHISGSVNIDSVNGSTTRSVSATVTVVTPRA